MKDMVGEVTAQVLVVLSVTRALGTPGETRGPTNDSYSYLG